MAKINNYPPVDSFTSEEKAEFLSGANFVASGCKTSGGPKVAANVPLNIISPTSLSDLTDDITQQTVVANDTRPVSGAAVSSYMASTGGFVITTLDQGHPAVTGDPDPKVFYLTPKTTSGTDNVYDEWIYTNNAWEIIGATTVDLTNYYTKTEVDNKVTVTDVTVGGTSVVSNKTAVITIPTQQNADWNASTGVTAILNKPTIPFTRTYAKFTGGEYSPGDQRFDLSQSSEVQLGLNTDNIRREGSFSADQSLWPRYYYYRVPVAGVYKMALALRLNSSSTSAGTTITNFSFGIARKGTDGSPVIRFDDGSHNVIDQGKLDSSGHGPIMDVHLHTTQVVNADEVFTPFIDYSISGINVTVLYMEFEKIGPAPQVSGN